jgi:hypothetical protein
MPVTATDERAACWEEVYELLQEFGVPKDRQGATVLGRDTIVVAEAAKWLKTVKPGLRNLHVMEQIARFTVGSEHDDNLNYLGRNDCIPQLPTPILEQQQIGPFFMAAREILKNGTSSRYLEIGKPPTSTSPKKV